MGTVSQASRNMKAFVIVALVAAVSGEADPYTIGQVLAGQTNGGVLTSTTYHGGVKVAGFPYTKVAAVPAVSYAAAYPYAHAAVYYGKREAEPEPWTVGQIAAGAHVAEAIKDGRAHNVGVITNAAIAPVAASWTGRGSRAGCCRGGGLSAGRSTPSTGWWRSTWSVGNWSLRRSTSPPAAHAWCTEALSCSQPQDFAGHQNLPFMKDINPLCCHLVLNHMPFNDI